MAFELSPLYPILDASYLPASMLSASVVEQLEGSAESARLPGDDARYAVLGEVVRSLAAAGVTVLQYRNKRDVDAQVVRDARWLREHAPASLRIVLNDRAHLVRRCEWRRGTRGPGRYVTEGARLLVGFGGS